MAYVLGLDGGIASVGWALLDEAGQRVVCAGSWCFDAPEDPKEKVPLNAIRRQHRGQRRVIRRRRQRMGDLRRLFTEAGLIASAERTALAAPKGFDPWVLRIEALSRCLDGFELAVALGHIARHRGFRSNSKRDRGGNATSDTSLMLSAIARNQDRLAGRTVAQMFAETYGDRKRNRGDYERTVLRIDLEHEAGAILAAQRRLGNGAATAEFEEQYARIAFSQRPLQNSEGRVRACTFEPTQKRTAKAAPSFERFRLLARLINLRLVSGNQESCLSERQIGVALEGFGKQIGLDFRRLRKLLDLAPGVRFAGVSEADEKRDVAARSGAAQGTAALRHALGEAGWRALLNRPALLDRAAEIITFRDDPASIREGLQQAGLEPEWVSMLEAAVERGAFAKFSGAAHISAKAARAVSAAMLQALPVNEAFAFAGYDHSARPATAVEEVANPVARKALGQMLRQALTVIHENKHLFGPLGLPDRIHVELGRDVGKSADERAEITNGIDKRTATRDRLRAELQGHLPGTNPTRDDMVRYELWKEQSGFCLYSGLPIPLEAVLGTENAVQVDHILPWSRFGDDSFRNKTLCMAKANQDKKGRTPFEWLGSDAAAWALFTARVDGCKEMRGGKKAGHYLRRNAEEVQQAFRSRNLNDTRYACRVLLDTLSRLYPKADPVMEVPQRRHTYARPGAITSKLRQAWGLEGRKKGPDGKRLEDDRHHALDAIVVAACSESMLNSLTRQVQQHEATGETRPFANIPPPWPGFREQVHAALDAVQVARPERRRARGEAHAATIRQVEEHEGKQVVYERKPVAKLTAADLLRVKDGEDRNPRLVASLRRWIEAGRPAAEPPLSPKGDVIRKVRLVTTDKVAVTVRGGTADRGDMARVDVFREDRPGKAARFHLVPIYPHQIADPLQVVPPDRAVVAYKPEIEWTLIDGLAFCFSLYSNSLIEILRPDGTCLRGYFRGLDRTTGAIAIAGIQSATALQRGIGTKSSVAAFSKLSIDRLGRISNILSETRTWRGAACI